MRQGEATRTGLPYNPISLLLTHRIRRFFAGTLSIIYLANTYRIDTQQQCLAAHHPTGNFVSRTLRLANIQWKRTLSWVYLVS